jgi:hypothetical protein
LKVVEVVEMGVSRTEGQCRAGAGEKRRLDLRILADESRKATKPRDQGPDRLCKRYAGRKKHGTISRCEDERRRRGGDGECEDGEDGEDSDGSVGD